MIESYEKLIIQLQEEIRDLNEQVAAQDDKGLHSFALYKKIEVKQKALEFTQSQLVRSEIKVKSRIAGR